MAQTIRIPVDLGVPQQAANQGNCYFDMLNLTDHDFGVWTLVKDVNGKVYGRATVPKNLSGTTGSLVVALAWANSASSKVARVSVAYSPIANGESLNPGSLTDVTAQDLSVPTTAYQRTDATYSLTGLAADDVLLVEVYHEGAHANDTVAVDTLVVEAWLECDVT